MTTREIRGHVEERYGVTVSAERISSVTDAVLEEVAEWQPRPVHQYTRRIVDNWFAMLAKAAARFSGVELLRKT